MIQKLSVWLQKAKPNIKQLLLNFAAGFIFLNFIGWLCATGESFPPPNTTEKAVYYIRVPVSSPITP